MRVALPWVFGKKRVSRRFRRIRCQSARRQRQKGAAAVAFALRRNGSGRLSRPGSRDMP